VYVAESDGKAVEESANSMMAVLEGVEGGVVWRPSLVVDHLSPSRPPPVQPCEDGHHRIRGFLHRLPVGFGHVDIPEERNLRYPLAVAPEVLAVGGIVRLQLGDVVPVGADERKALDSSPPEARLPRSAEPPRNRAVDW